LRSTITTDEAISGLPTLEAAQIDASNLADRLQPSACDVRTMDISGQRLAIFASAAAKIDGLLAGSDLATGE
jgi:hypothetical protein